MINEMGLFENKDAPFLINFHRENIWENDDFTVAKWGPLFQTNPDIIDYTGWWLQPVLLTCGSHHSSSFHYKHFEHRQLNKKNTLKPPSRLAMSSDSMIKLKPKYITSLGKWADPFASWLIYRGTAGKWRCNTPDIAIRGHRTPIHGSNHGRDLQTRRGM